MVDMQSSGVTTDSVEREIAELTSLLQVLALAIEGARIDPKNTWHHCEDVPALARRVARSGKRIAALLAAAQVGTRIRSSGQPRRGTISGGAGRRRRGSSRR